MKLRTFITAVVFVSGTAVFGQEVSTPKVEAAFNYTYTRTNAGGSIGSFSASGGSGYVEYNVNRYLGLVGEVGANTVGIVSYYSLGNTELSYLFGPRLNLRSSKRITPYIQTLVGGVRFSSAYDSNLAYPVLGGGQNNFAAAIGGGIDIQVNSRLALKPFQLDYLLTEIPNTASNVNEAQNNLRYSAGVVFKFGSK